MSEFRAARPRREKILAYGDTSVGKTHALLTVAKRLVRTGSDARIYVLSTDGAYEAMLDDARFDDCVDRFEVKVCRDWETLRETTKKFAKKIAPDDWFSVDLITPTWTMVQEDYLEKVFGRERAEHLREIRKEMLADAKAHKDKRGGLNGLKDWGIINAEYASWLQDVIFCDGHVYLVAEQDKISDEDKADVKETFGGLSRKPRGNKSVPFYAHTILYFGRSSRGRIITTAKDRGGREELEGQRLNDFSRDYLLRVAGWEKGTKNGSADE